MDFLTLLSIALQVIRIIVNSNDNN